MKGSWSTPKPAARRPFNWTRWLMSLLAGLVFFYGVSLLLQEWLATRDAWADIAAFSAWLTAAQPWLRLWRLFCFAVLIGGYDTWVNKLADRSQFNPKQRAYALSQRWRVAGLLLAVELLFVQNGFAWLIRSF